MAFPTAGRCGRHVAEGSGAGDVAREHAVRHVEQDVRQIGPVHGVYGQINVYGVTTKSERYERSYWTRTAAGNGIGGRKAPVPYGS